MIEPKLAARLAEAARSISPLAAVTGSSLDLRRFAAGETLRAQVASRHADGTFRVMIDGKALKLALPADIEPGDALELRVVAKHGEFTVVRRDAGSYDGRALSSAGRLIGNLLGQAPAPAPRQARPVLDSPPETAANLTQPLARALERSGLFYESHQARWVGGDYPLERLLEEPQATLGAGPGPGASKNSAPAQPPQPNAMPLPVASSAPTGADAHDANPSGPNVAVTHTGSQGPESHSDLIARETIPFVRQQLEALDTRQLVWLGEIWPGQPMRWEIGEDPESCSDDAPPDEWRSRVEMSLPALGKVAADLVLSAGRLRIRLTARDEATAAMMQAGGPDLRRALEAAGLAPIGLEVQRDESDH